MPAIPITKHLCTNPPAIPEGKSKVRIFDTRVKGFIMEFRRGFSTAYFRYQDQRGRLREVKLGRLGDVTLEQVRARAEQLRAETSLGRDPLAEIDQKKAIPTVEAFITERYMPQVRERLRSHANVAAYCRRIVACFGNKALDEVTPADIATLRRRLVAEKLSNGSVNRHLATSRNLFNVARKFQLFAGPNPASSPGMMAETHRDVRLTAQQTQALVHALDLESNRGAAEALLLLIVTGARKNEILKAKWEYVDLERRLLTVPRSKSGKPRYIPLSPFAIRVLVERMQRRRPEDAGFVFPSEPGKPLYDVRGAWKRAKRAAGLLPSLRVHDLRHSFASALANSGIPLNEIGVVLGHQTLSTTARYVHHAPQRMVATATVAAEAWNLLPSPAPRAG